MPAAAAADVQAEFAVQRVKAALERPQQARGDSGGMPIHSHERAKRLKPERMRQAAEEFVAPVVVNDGFAEQRAEQRHPVGKPLLEHGRYGEANRRYRIVASRWLFC